MHGFPAAFFRLALTAVLATGRPIRRLLLVVALPLALPAAAPEARLTEIRWLPDVSLTASASDSDLVRLAQIPGRKLPSLADAAFAPFRPEWFAITLAPPQPGQPRLNFTILAMMRREIDAFLVLDGRVIARASGGFARPKPDDEFERGNFHLALPAWEKGQATLLLRTVTVERLPFNERLIPDDELHESNFATAAIMLFFSGCTLAFLALQIFLIVLNPSNVAARDYAIFLLLAWATPVNRLGWFSYDLLPGSWHLFPGDCQLILKAAVVCFVIKVVETSLELPSWSPDLQRRSRHIRFGIVAAITIGLAISPTVLHQLVSFLFFPASVWGVYLGYRAIRRGVPSSPVFLIGWLALGGTTALANLMIAGIVPSLEHLQYLGATGLLWMMLMNSIALLLTFRSHERELAKNREARAALSQTTRLLQTICHDLAAPLMAVRFASHLLKGPLAPGANPESQREALEAVRQGNEQAFGIVNDVRKLVVSGFDSTTLPQTEVDVAQAGRNSINALSGLALAKQVKLVDELPGAIKARGVQTLLEGHVLNNLLQNAVKFTPPGSQVTLSVVTAPGRVGLRIADEGTGIPPTALAALEAGDQVPSRIGTLGERGTGFGLLIAKDFAAAMGGKLELGPRPKGEAPGTVATIWLSAVS